MKNSPDSFEDYLKSGEYYRDALKWYKFKYLHVFTQRSQLFLLCLIFSATFLLIAINLNNLLPIIQKVRYSISSKDALQNTARITRANIITNRPLMSVVDLMVKNYVMHREVYDSDKVESQLLFIQNNSTRLVYRKFYNYLDIVNPNSPALRYQKFVRRSIIIRSISYPEFGEALVNFTSIAKTSGGEIMENINWLASISYEIDNLNPKLPTNSRYNFTVTNYKLKLLEDRTSK